MRSNLCAAAVLAGVLFPAARAQDASPRPQPSGVIEEVFVRALAPPADDAAAFATVIDASEFPGRAIDLGSVLQRVPSARTQSYGGIGRFATVSLRGSSAEQVTVLVDGVPQNRALGGAVDLSSIPVSLVQRVTVFRGFGPPGTGLGGLVDIRTRRPGPAPQASADVLAGTLDTVLGTADGSLAIPGGRLRVSGETFRSAGDFGYLPGENSGVGTAGEPRRTRRRNNDVDSRAGALHAAWDDVLSGQLSAIVRVREREQGIPGTGDSPLGHVRLEDSGASAVAAWSRAVGGAALESLDVQLDALSERSLLSNPAGEAVIHADEQLTRTSGGGMLAVARWSLGAHRLSTSLGARTERSHIRDEGLSVAERG
ncbi:MAG: TonB-dependent receptor plug domain-containing protein, partial [Acidobacteria bacterium]|nr:TonB-dependent receptor plug domain-containing protein [Acidobacteriota bacterium]